MIYFKGNMNLLVGLLSLFGILLNYIVIGVEDIPGVSMAYHPQPNKPGKQAQEHSNNNMNTQPDGSHLLHSGMEKMIRSDGREKLEVFCCEGESPNLANLLKTVEMRISIPNDNFQYYQADNATAVYNLYKESSWFSFAPWKPTSFRMNLYNLSCIGIETKETFRIALVVRHVDLWRVLALSVGLALFFTAPLLAHNVVFHYATGVSVGVFGSLLVIVFIVSRSIPKKTGAITFLLGGWGLVLYFVQYLWLNCLSMLKEYYSFFVGYVFVIGLASFALVYRYGPLTDQRSISLVQWTLQLVALLSIFFSCQCREVTLALIIILIGYYNIPLSWKLHFRTYWLRYFPPKQHLISDEEFLEQSRIETKKALQDLREFCHSPKCNAWKTMSRLTSPQRFAEFVEGSSHLSDDEMISYENTNHRVSDDAIDPYLTSDEEDLEVESNTR